VKIPCPQCGGEVQLQEAAGFPRCPFCGTSLALDLTGVRPHMLYRPRHGPAEVLPWLRRWCGAHSLPAPSAVSAPQLAYRPFWRFASQGHPRLVPAWSALEVCWTDVPIPEGEQVIYDPSIVGAARVIEQSVAETAARARLFGASAASVPAGDLVHVPFYDLQATIGAARVAASMEACSGRVYPERMPAGAKTSTVRGAGAVTTAIGGFIFLFLEAMLIPPVWLAAGAVGLTAVMLYWAVTASMRNSSG
jgi:hypothetical protein